MQEKHQQKLCHDSQWQRLSVCLKKTASDWWVRCVTYSISWKQTVQTVKTNAMKNNFHLSLFGYQTLTE